MMLHPRTAGALAAFALITAAVCHAAAGETLVGTTTVRSGSHTGFGRIVIDTSGQTGYQLHQDGDRVVVRFGDDVLLAPPPSVPRNMMAIKTDGPVVELTLKPGTLLHATRLSGRVVLDALDAPTKAAAAPKTRSGETVAATKTEAAIRSPTRTSAKAPAPATSTPVTPAPATPATSMPATSMPAEPLPNTPVSKPLPQRMQSGPSPAMTGSSEPSGSPQAPMAADRLPVAAQPLPPPPMAAAQPMEDDANRQTPPGRDAVPEDSGPVGLRARRVKLPKEVDGTAFLVPFDSTTAAASFQTRDAIFIVFDERRPVDMAALRNDPVFGAVSVQLLPNGTLFRMKLPPARFVALTQMPQGWRIAALTTAPRRLPIVVAFADGRLHLAAEQSGDVVTLTDPDTGATLLVGTQHRTGQGVATTRRSTQFILRPTLQGIVVEPLADSISLKPVATGFNLASEPTGLALSSAMNMTDMVMDAAHLTRRLTLPAMPTEVLLRRANKQLADAAAAPPMARGPKHHAAAQSFMALGFSAEAASLLRMAAEQDPKEAASAETGALTAIAALLAGRTDEAGALADPRLDGTDEIALWRAVRQAMREEGSPAAAAVFAATAPLVFQYPKAIRDHILPLMIETMIQGGEIAPAARLLDTYKDDPRLAYAHALMRTAEGDTGQALSMLDTLAAGHDQFDRARAATGAVELRLAARTIDKTRAADALDKLLYSWRGDARDLALRERVAELRGQSGAWRSALATLRQAEADFPDQAAPIRQRLNDTFAAMIRDQGTQRIPPIEFVSMVAENADLIAASSDDDLVEQSLADRLYALDLPARAKPVLQKLLRSATSDVSKARLGASLATLESRGGNDSAALAALTASSGPDLPPDLAEQRAIIQAGSVARLGDPAAAAGLLVPFHTGPATDVRAQILEGGGDWPGAARAWADRVALTVPDSGKLDDAGARIVLRLATATARAGDDSGLAELRMKFGGRIGTGPVGDMFRLLTAEPIRTTADIGRSQREMSLAASLPGDLKALQSSVAAR